MPEPDYQRGAQLALANGRQLLEDAELLLKRGSHGHALALASSGIEELAKAEIYIMTKEGVREIPNWEPLTDAGAFKAEDVQKVHRDHEFKYRRFLSFLSLSWAVSVAYGFPEALRLNLVGTVINERVNAKKLETDRRNALYVDHRDGRWMGPFDVSDTHSNFLISYGKKYALWVEDVLEKGWNAKMQTIRSLVKDTVYLVKKLQEAVEGKYDLEVLLGPETMEVLRHLIPIGRGEAATKDAEPLSRVEDGP